MFVAVGIWVSHEMDKSDVWTDAKYDAFLVIQKLRGGEVRVPQTTLVAIGDEEYYSPELGARKPLRRDYLARLVAKLAMAKPRLLVLDVDLRSPVPRSGAPDFDIYRNEDMALIEALCEARWSTPIVVAKAVYSDVDRGVVAESDVYQRPDAPCTIPNDRIAVGYLALPTDLRRVPLSLELENGAPVDSLALAAARLLAPKQYQNMVPVDELPYGRFHTPAAFTRIDARHVIDGTRAQEVAGQIVLIYGDWHVLAKEQGSSVVDTFRTPVGVVGGAFVHANLIETLLAAEQFSSTPKRVAFGVELAVAFMLAVAFAFPAGLFRKLLILLATTAAIAIVSWLSLQVFALFFDILPLLLAMYVHAVADQVEEWRRLARRAHGH